MEADELFENAIAWLNEHYGEFRFFAERDVVWTVQKQIIREIEGRSLPYRVFNDYTVLPPARTDLVILNPDDSVEIAIEFKYEPAHTRRANRGGDIWPSKFPVVSWSGVQKDLQRIREYVELGKARIACSVLIDEGGHFHHRKPPPGSEWINWGQDRWVLWAQASRD